MKLIHYSGVSLTTILPRRPPRGITSLLGDCKPLGLWVSVDDEWEEWCRNEDFNLAGLAHATEIQLVDKAKILWITDATELDCFTTQYQKNGQITKTLGCLGWEIDWDTVAKQYQGIIIAPYIRSRRFAHHTMWYYGWDCASGCIWDGNAVAKIIPMERKDEHQS
jgi:hypothetical protein